MWFFLIAWWLNIKKYTYHVSYHYSYSYLLKRNENMSAQKGIHKVSLQFYSLKPKRKHQWSSTERQIWYALQ